jgi:hypothetical protein
MLKVYGPYVRKDGRKHVVIYDFKKGIRRTVSYPKYLMEKFLGRKLKGDETVDHINNDFTDDRIENLQILSRADNIRKSTPKRKIFVFICPVCGKESSKYLSNVNNNKRQHKSGPFCSRSCAGKGSYVNHWKVK